jgi:hypothetical protein
MDKYCKHIVTYYDNTTEEINNSTRFEEIGSLFIFYDNTSVVKAIKVDLVKSIEYKTEYHLSREAKDKLNESCKR